MQITLTASESVLCEYLATNKYTLMRGIGAPDELAADRRDPIENDRLSIEAELAVCKFLNVYPSLDWSRSSPYDLKYLGLLIDVKRTSRGNLNIRSDKNLKADLYVGVSHVEETTWNVDGFLTREAVERHALKPGVTRGDGSQAPSFRSIPLASLSKDWRSLNNTGVGD